MGITVERIKELKMTHKESLSKYFFACGEKQQIIRAHKKIDVFFWFIYFSWNSISQHETNKFKNPGEKASKN